MLALIFTAQILASTPTPVSTPVIKAETGTTRTLADVARERKLGKQGVQGGTLSVAGASVRGGSVGTAAVSAAGGADEAEWTQRNAAARRELADARGALANADANLPRWSVTGRGSAHTAAMLDQTRENALLPYRMRVAEAQTKVDALPEAARKAGAYPGWVRPTTDEEAHAERRIGLAEMEKQINNGDAPLPPRDREGEK